VQKVLSKVEGLILRCNVLCDTKFLAYLNNTLHTIDLPAQSQLKRDFESENQMFETKTLPTHRDAVAPDGSDVRILLRLQGGSMAHFEIEPNAVSKAVVSSSIEEIWYFLSGRGEMWRSMGTFENVVAVSRGVCITIPEGTQFQFRSFGSEPLAAIGITMPPWPGEEVVKVVEGIWESTLP
jgi:mannose-6-phosphate isomerase-like protein (cupin superfamily)